MTELHPEEQINWDDFSVGDEPDPQPEPQAEPEPQEAVEPQEEPEPQPSTDRPRDPETGQFVSQEQAEQAEQERLFAGKYRSAEELERAYLESQQLQGRMSGELGEMRQQFQQVLEQMQQPRATYDLDEMIDENPVQAAQMALASGDRLAYQRVIESWRENDPVQVAMWEQSQQAQLRAWQAEQRAQQIEQSLQQLQAPLAQQNAEANLAAAWAGLQQEFPDLEQLRPAMLQEAERLAQMTGEPVITRLIESGDPEQIRYALRTLASNARMQSPESLRAASEQLARQHAAERQRAVADAAVASATTTAPEPDTPKTYGDEFLEELMAEDQARDGWQVGNY